MEIPGYKLGRVIGAGKVCTNYNALDVKHSKTVIVKVFNEALSRNQTFQNHFRNVTGRLVNKELGNNVQYLDAIINSDTCALVINYCARSTGRQGKLSEYSESKAVEIGRQLSASLSKLHNLGVVHGGVELANINFSDNGQIVLGAVALHRTIPGIDVSKLVLENIHEFSCLAPEASNGLTASSDFFSLGVVLYELLTGRKPFNAESVLELEQKKRNGKYLPLKEKLLHLTPLFEGLFSPDPESRISSNEQFNSILNFCSKDFSEINLDSSQYLHETETSAVTDKPGGSLSTSSKAENRSVLLAVGAVVLAAIAVLVVIISGKKDVPQQAVDENQSQVVSSRSESIIRAPETPEETEQQTEENGFYANAMALVQEGDYDAALKAIDHALTTGKDKDRAEILKEEIVRELKIRSYLAIAEQQYIDNKLVLPPGDNAYDTYQRIANISPDEDERAVAGIQRIVDRYLEQAKQHVGDNNPDAAMESIAQGLMLNPDYKPLQELKSSLATAKVTPAVQAVSEQARLEKVAPPSMVAVPAAPKPDSKAGNRNGIISRQAIAKKEDTKNLIQRKRAREEKARAQEAKRRAEEQRAKQWRLEQERAAELVAQQKLERERIARQKEAERQAVQQRELAERETDIVRRLTVAEQQLAKSPLSLIALETAENEYHSLVKLAKNDARVQRLYQKILDSHVTIANSQKNAAQLSAAMQTVDRGLALNQGHKKLNSLKREIIAAIEEAEKKQKEIPVIGTF